jgi:hypothetical protein
MQMISAPWSDKDWLVMAGGWQDMDLNATKRLIASAPSAGRIYGNMAAMDDEERFAAHDSRQPGLEYFAQRLRQQIPAGLTAEQTARRAGGADGRREHSLYINRLLTWFVGIFIAVIVLGRLVLARERTRRYRKTLESPLANVP